MGNSAGEWADAGSEVHYIVSEPVRINSDSDFATSPKVTGGNGSEDDPWVIENYDINAGVKACCIYVGNTTEHFIIRNCLVQYATGAHIQYYWNAGIALWNATNGTLFNNTANGNHDYGIRLESCARISIIQNNATNTVLGSGIQIWDSVEITVADNICNDNYNNGILLYLSNDIEMHDNSAARNSVGIDIWDSDWNVVYKNNAFLNEVGISLQEASNNEVYWNSVSTNSMWGIQVVVSGSYNHIYHNNIMNNVGQAFDNTSPNPWDAGYPLGGNYWSDHTSVDANHGPLQNLPGPDCIRDAAYTNIVDNIGAKDRYPLAAQFDGTLPRLLDSTPPTSSVDSFAHYWNKTSPVNISVTASDNYGVLNVSLWYRFSADNATWGAWTYRDADVAGPWVFSFGFSDGDGFYEFYSMAADYSGNCEAEPAGPYARCAHDSTPPVADAGGDRAVAEDATIELNGSASWDSNGIANYTWTFIDCGQDIALFGASIEHIFTAPGNYTVTLNVTDPASNWRTDITNLTVADVTSPIAEAGIDRAIEQNHDVGFDGSGSADNVGISNYTWTFINNGTQVALWGATPEYSSFWIPGEYAVTLAVRDAANNTATDTMTVRVMDAVRPICDAGPDQHANPGATISFNGSASTDNLGIVNYTWNFTDGGAVSLYGPAPTYRFDNIGTYLVTLNVTDAAGNRGMDSMNVTVSDITTPAARAGPDQAVTEGVNVTFNGSDSSDNIGIVNYTWTFTHNSTAVTLYGVSPTFRFWESGNHTVTLNVTDAAGNWATDTMVVCVTAAEELPPVSDGGIDFLWLAAIATIIAIAVVLSMFMLKKGKPSEPKQDETKDSGGVGPDKGVPPTAE